MRLVRSSSDLAWLALAVLACAACGSSPCLAPEADGVCVYADPVDGGCGWGHAFYNPKGPAYCRSLTGHPPPVVFDAGSCPYQQDEEPICN